MPSRDPNSGEITPRNIVWVEDMPPDFRIQDRFFLKSSRYTHAIVCFFHLDPGPKLVYNGPRNPFDPTFDDWWSYLGGLRQDQHPKTLMLSVGGWNSGTWKRAEGNETAGAEQIVKFAQEKGFAGIDFNFEGDSEEGGYANANDRARILATFARLVVEVRNIWTGLLTITPMRFEITTQLQYIKTAFGSADWKDCLSWINAQFYTYEGLKPNPEPDVARDYESVLAEIQVPARMVAAGFPLSETDLQFNQRELQAAKTAVRDIYSTHPDFAGLFVWRFRGAFLGDRSGQPLNWALEFSKILHTPEPHLGT
jgi:chitinase